LLKRSFTIMVVPDARSRFRRFHVGRRGVLIGVSAAAVLALLALASPWFALSSWLRGSAADELAAENRALKARTEDFEAAVAELQGRLEGFEKQTKRLAWLAGDMDDAEEITGAGSGEIPGDGSRESLLQAEFDVLRERGEALGERIDHVAELFVTQADRLASVPAILPVQGLMGHGYQWRRDPFTGRRRFHHGLDISAPTGTPVRAPADGVVVKAHRYGGYGNVVYISHGNGLVTRYGHLERHQVSPGQRVRRGEIIATVGNTGRSTAPHLHYEVLLHNRRVDPLKYVVDTSLTP
jgi:murein DD-endopeptidase MepM/ murein hydrolase activator NlpD